MIQLLARKSKTGDVSIQLARQLLERNEWGLALKALEEAFRKGGLSDPYQARRLLQDVSQRLGLDKHSERIT